MLAASYCQSNNSWETRKTVSRQLLNTYTEVVPGAAVRGRMCVVNAHSAPRALASRCRLASAPTQEGRHATLPNEALNTCHHTAKNRTPWAAGRASGAWREPAASLTALGWVLDGPGPPEGDERRAGAARSLLRSSAPLRREARPGGSGTRGKKGGKAEGGKLPPHGPKAWGTPAGRGPLWTLLEGDSQLLAPCFTRTNKTKQNHLGLEFYCHWFANIHK